jgi:hypothetical protein
MDKPNLSEALSEIDKSLNFIQELSKETDRGCALMATSYLDFMLERLLRSKLIGSKKELDQLLNFTGPFGTFSSRIKGCYSLGIINKVIKSDLEKIRAIRNVYGHSYESLDFSTPEIYNLTLQLQENLYSPDQKNGRTRFTNTVHIVASTIDHQINHFPKFHEPTIETWFDRKKMNKDEVYQLAKIMANFLDKKGKLDYKSAGTFFKEVISELLDAKENSNGRQIGSK